jgi:hypothetical protein
MLRIVKYVVDSENLKLKINPNEVHEGEWHVMSFTDSDFSGDRETRKSVSGFIVYFMGAPIAWRPRGQKSVTLSSMEAEYVAVLEVATEVVFVKNLLEFLGLKISYPITLYVDNVGAIYLAESSISGMRTKHVDTRYHYVREYIEEGVLKIIFVRSEENQADPFTKNLEVECFDKHVGNFMDKGE